MFDFAIRNLSLYLKDRMAVLLSFLAEFIVVGLYILFMRANLVEGFSEIRNVELLMDTWMIAGILGITSVTTTMGAYGIMVDDRVKNINRDFNVSPIKSYSLLGGYMSQAVATGIFMTLFLFLLSAVYILHRYHVQLADGQGGTLFLLVILITISNSSMVLFVISFLKSSNALASCSTIVGALIGFLTGIYLPMGNLPDGVQRLVKCFPVSHAVVLLRQILMEPLMQESFEEVEHVFQHTFVEYMGIEYIWEGECVSKVDSILFLATTAGLFFIATMVKEKNSARL